MYPFCKEDFIFTTLAGSNHFIEGRLMKHDAPLARFDPLVWQAVINYATVNRDCTITFTFRDGTEKTVPIKNGVRPYTKRNKPQEVNAKGSLQKIHPA